MKLFSFFAAALLTCLLPVGASAQAKKLNVLTTFAPISSLTKNIAGDAAEVEQLLPPDAEPHHFALSPSDLKKIAKADVLVENGLGAEDWVERALKGSRATRIIASKGIKTDDGNPHVWLDPVLAIAQVENIATGLAERDPANAAVYKRNAAAYIEKLKALDKEIRAVADQLPDKRLMTSHGAFHYFAKRYQFEVVGVFEEFPGREPSPKALRSLRDTIAKNKVKVLFTEPGQPRRVLRNLSKELALPVVEIDPMEYGRPDAALYEKVMRSNLRNLKEALGGGR
jgi:zinc transport system substrate-binding protein